MHIAKTFIYTYTLTNKTYRTDIHNLLYIVKNESKMAQMFALSFLFVSFRFRWISNVINFTVRPALSWKPFVYLVWPTLDIADIPSQNRDYFSGFAV